MNYLAGLCIIGYLVADYWVHKDMLKREEKEEN